MNIAKNETRGWIIETFAEEALGLVTGLDTKLVVYEALKDVYAQDSQEHEFTLQKQPSYLRKDDNKTIGNHICIFKGLCNNLAGIGNALLDKEKESQQHIYFHKSWIPSTTISKPTSKLFRQFNINYTTMMTTIARRTSHDSKITRSISNAPFSLWLKALTIVVFLINRLPSSPLHFDTPYSMLYETHPSLDVTSGLDHFVAMPTLHSDIHLETFYTPKP
ncbi:hypothetical protein SADUNF_Sadunf18G0023600 [Salix dunnii]|uniref:Uncharacterized protein n=1 Tax=Salix dunnii TaxID=1413687 RepID=A0A835MLU1_9ROSI|nr:hypothetical protein SADUNF_Sadunf18G0023600 [Salix dunnii]